MKEATAETAMSRRSGFYFPPSEIDLPDGLNIRDMAAEIKTEDFQQLKASIKEHGVKVPIQVKLNPDKNGAKYVPVDGFRRLTAVKMLIEEGHDIQSVFGFTNANITEEDTLINMFVMNGGKALNPLERAEGVRRFIEVCGYDIKKVALKISEKEATVRNLYAICKLPHKVQKHISSNTIAATLALQLSRSTKTESEFVELVEDLVNQKSAATGEAKVKITARDTVKHIGEKNPIKLLNTVYATLDSEGVSNDRVALLKSILDALNDSPTIDKLISIFQ